MALWIDPVACCTLAPQRDHSSPHSRRASRARGSCASRPHPRAPPLAGAARGPALSHVPAVRPATACYSAAAVLLLGFFSFFFLNSFCKSSSPKPRLKQTRIFAPHPEDRRWPFQLLLHIRESAEVSLSKKLTVFGIVATGVGPIKGFFESSWKCPGLALGTAEFRGGLLFP